LMSCFFMIKKVSLWMPFLFLHLHFFISLPYQRHHRTSAPPLFAVSIAYISVFLLLHTARV
jgi:hypothetical protein